MISAIPADDLCPEWRMKLTETVETLAPVADRCDDGRTPPISVSTARADATSEFEHRPGEDGGDDKSQTVDERTQKYVASTASMLIVALMLVVLRPPFVVSTSPKSGMHTGTLLWGRVLLIALFVGIVVVFAARMRRTFSHMSSIF